MPWIRQIDPADATGLLAREFERARQRAGRIWNIVRIMSLNAPVLQASMQHYGAVMHGASGLSRSRRELLATVVSAELGCRY